MGRRRNASRAAAALAAFAVVVLSGIGSEHSRLVLADVAELVAPIIAAVAAWRAGSRSRGAAARGWKLLAASTASWAAGQALWSWFELVQHSDPFPSPADAGFLLAVPLGWAAMVSFHRAWRRPSAAGVATLDGVAAAAALLVVSWVLVLRPSWDGTIPRFELALSLAYPAGGAITIAVVLSVVAGSNREARRAVALITGGYLALAVADSVFAWLTLHGSTQSLTIADVAWVGGFLVLAVAASGRPPRGEADRMSQSPLWLVLLPYAPVGIALVVAIFDIEPAGIVDPVVLIAASVMILAILGRQAATMFENQGLVGDLADKIDELRDNEDHLRHQAFHDGLTGLANRRLFTDRVEHALARNARGGDVAVLLVDLDDFKNINDTLGHFAGDQLLVEVSARFASVVRSGDTVARLGGDEFAVLIEHVDDDDLPDAVADRLLRVLDDPVALAERDVVVRASVGYAIAAPGTTAEELFGDADLALYAAKDAGKQVARPFAQELRRAAVDRMELTAALHDAVHQLEVHYQPIVDIGAHAARPIGGVEALVRWRHPELGLLAPARFIPLAEETGLIVDIGRAVLEQACAQTAAWREAIGPLTVNVNLSGRQLLHGDVVADVAGALQRSGLPAEALVLEITESVLTPPGPELLDRLHGLRDLGVVLAVDDFGAGYSSLNYLRTLPVGVLKIDKVFVDAAGNDGDGDVLLRAIVDLGHSLGLTVVAEGVERASQLAALRRLGCEQAQGFLLGRPAPAAETERHLRLRTSEGAPVA